MLRRRLTKGTSHQLLPDEVYAILGAKQSCVHTRTENETREGGSSKAKVDDCCQREGSPHRRGGTTRQEAEAAPDTAPRCTALMMSLPLPPPVAAAAVADRRRRRMLSRRGTCGPGDVPPAGWLPLFPPAAAAPAPCPLCTALSGIHVSRWHMRIPCQHLLPAGRHLEARQPMAHQRGLINISSQQGITRKPRQPVAHQKGLVFISCLQDVTREPHQPVALFLFIFWADGVCLAGKPGHNPILQRCFTCYTPPGHQ